MDEGELMKLPASFPSQQAPPSFAPPSQQHMVNEQHQPEEQQQQNGSSRFGRLLSFKEMAMEAGTGMATRAKSALTTIQAAGQAAIAARQDPEPQRFLSSDEAVVPEAQGVRGNLMHLGSEALQAAVGLSKRTRESGGAALSAAVAGMRRITAPTRSVAAVCKADLRVKPAPQVLLLCCNVIVLKGLTTETQPGLFKTPPGIEGQEQQKAAAALAHHLEGPAMLLTPTVTPELAALAIKHFLSSLQEPLLNIRLAGRWVAVGVALAVGDSSPVAGLLHDLPLASLSSLRLLLETCFLVASQSNVTGMNARALADELAPALLWWGEAGPVYTGSGALGAGQVLVASMQALQARLGGLTPSHAPPEEDVQSDARLSPELVMIEEVDLEGSRAASFLDVPARPGGAQESQRVAGEAVSQAQALQGDDLVAVAQAIQWLILNFTEAFQGTA